MKVHKILERQTNVFCNYFYVDPIISNMLQA